MTKSSETLSVDGVLLGYGVYGAAANKPPLIFVHGYAMRSTEGPYEVLLERLADRFTVYALDLRGHGASADALAGWSIEALADDVVALSRHLGLNQPVFVGHSLGAFTGLFAEIRHPGSFAALCLITPAAAELGRDAPAEMVQVLLEQGRDRSVMREVFRQVFVDAQAGELERVVDAVTLLEADVHRMFFEQSPKLSIDDRLKAVTAPVLLVVGERDVVVLPALQHDMARKLQRCKEIVFSLEGHMLPNERPATTAREILAFLEHDCAEMAGT